MIQVKAQSKVIHVLEGQRIQDAINDASSGDIILVEPGVYPEKIVVNKSNLTVKGEGSQFVFIDGCGDGPVVRVSGDGVVFGGFTVRNGGSKPGVEVSGDCVALVNNSFVGCGYGVQLYYCSGVVVQRNSFSGNTVGISLYGASNSSIANNTVTKSIYGGHGIAVLSSSINNKICGNLIWNNSHGMWFSGGSRENIVAENTIVKNNIIGIELTDGYNNLIYHNNFIDNKKQVTTNTVNKWDNGYPSGGNYWNDYKSKYPESKDEHSGVNQRGPGSDGIWDNPYTVYSSLEVPPNIDKYPLVRPFGRIPDEKPPKTIHDYDGLWRNKDFYVNLTANDDLSGVEEIYYRVNNEEPPKKVVEDGQPLISTEGTNNTIEFWSVDFMGNEEKHNFILNIKLDKTAPTADAGENRTVIVGTVVVFNASDSLDELSGISSFHWDLGNGITKSVRDFSYNFTEVGIFRIVLTVTDVAGNKGTDIVFVSVASRDAFPRNILPISGLVIAVTAFTILALRKVGKKRRRFRRLGKPRR